MPITKENNAKHLAQMANLFKELANVTIKFESHLHESASNFPAKVVLKTIATISTELQGVQNLVHLYTNSMDTKSKDFSQLRQVYVIPLAYAQLLMELDFRQQHFQELYSVFRLAAREFLDGLCQFENTRREKFNETSTLLQSSVPGQHLLPSLPSTTNLMSSTATAAGATSATSTALMINSSKTKQLFIKPFYILGLDEKVELTSVLYSKISSSQLPLVTADDLKELRAVIEAYRSSNTNLVTFILNDLDRHAQWFASTVQYMTASCSVVRQNNLAFKKNTNLPLTSSGVKNMAENEVFKI